jgi:hypothetical protein
MPNPIGLPDLAFFSIVNRYVSLNAIVVDPDLDFRIFRQRRDSVLKLLRHLIALFRDDVLRSFLQIFFAKALMNAFATIFASETSVDGIF